jgi:hypothetical protein
VEDDDVALLDSHSLPINDEFPQSHQLTMEETRYDDEARIHKIGIEYHMRIFEKDD